MGGAVNIGIRYSDGSLVAGEVWTNPIPHMVLEMSMLSTDAEFDAHLAAYMDEAVDGSPHQTVVPYGYGLIFFDVQTKTLLSMQGYSSLNRLHSFSRRDQDETKLLEQLHQAGRISFEIIQYPAWKEPSADEPKVVQEPPKLIRAGKSNDFSSFDEFRAYYNSEGFKSLPNDVYQRGDAMYSLDPWTKVNFPESSAGAIAFRAKLVEIGIPFSPAEVALWDQAIRDAQGREAESADESETA
ncbi:MAG: hypothetical protein EOP83_31370 [Verrucomicrobiaceae bacterium]|nr:MAG: hypothetical protein EOP83_31370 [Verrucomicrobiaceae bacterium]